MREPAQKFSVYTTVTCQTVSPDGQMYAACTENGCIFISKIENLLQDGHKLFNFYGFNKEAVFSLASTNEVLFAGGRGEVRGWRWSDLETESTEPTILLRVGPPGLRTRINWLDIEVDNEGAGGRDRLIAGCGDNNVYVFSLATTQLKHTLTGHTSFVHCVASTQSAGLSVVSSGEDGAVKLWDTRKSGEEVFSFSPDSEGVTKRPKYGKFISTVSCQGDWLACGGGPVSSLWNLTTRIMSGSLPPESGVVYATKILDDRIYTSGQNTNLCVSNYGGETLATVALKSSCIYSLAFSNSHNILAAAGASSYIDFIDTKDHTVLKSFSLFPAKPCL